MKYRIRDLTTIYRGSSPRPIQDYLSDTGWPWLKISDFCFGDRVVCETKQYIKEIKNTKLVKKGTLVLTNSASPGIPIFLGKDICLHDGFLYFEEISDKLDKNYLFYWLTHYRQNIVNLANGSVFRNLKKEIVENLEIDLPDLKTQKQIVRILSALDQKIELNNQQNETLFELGRQLYIEKFENNETINKVELGDFFPVVTGKKDANASSENGKYPFFTCSKTISKIDDYVFDNSAILLAGNGDFNVKFYRGKFDAYQRTYVLIPNNPDYLGFLYWAISYNLPRITANYRGSVIKFITKGNIESFKVSFVDNKYIPAFMKYLERIEKNNQQNKVLAGLRGTLLPKLMSGEINLNEVTIK